jgi:hypothetical protein
LPDIRRGVGQGSVMYRRHRKQNPLADIRTFLSPVYLVHRGAPARVVNEIVSALGSKAHAITVLGSGRPDTPLAELRTLLASKAAEHDAAFIVLLNRHFDGPACRQTLAPLRKQGFTGYSLIRVEECAVDPRNEVSVDLAAIRGHSSRRRAILGLVPRPYRAMCMGTGSPPRSYAEVSR